VSTIPPLRHIHSVQERLKEFKSFLYTNICMKRI